MSTFILSASFCSSFATSQYPVLCSQSQPANGYKIDSLWMAIASSWRDDPMLCMKVCEAVETEGPSSHPHTPVPQTVCKQSEQPACLFFSRFTGHVSTLSSDLGLSTSSLSTIISVETSGRSLCSPASCPSCLTGVSHHESLIDQKAFCKANDLHFTCFLAAGKWDRQGRPLRSWEISDMFVLPRLNGTLCHVQ